MICLEMHQYSLVIDKINEVILGKMVIKEPIILHDEEITYWLSHF